VNEVQDIFNEYARMRQNGVDSKSVLNVLRPHIEGLPKAQRDELSSLLRTWEAQTRPATEANRTRMLSPDPDATQPQRPPSLIKPLSGGKVKPPTNPASVQPPSPAAPPERAAPASVEWVACPNCGKNNQRTEVFCYSCGQLLEPVRGTYDTRHFSDASASQSAELSSEYFGPETVLVLRVRGSTETYELRPQQSDHELVVGRTTAGSAIAPDVDLTKKQAADLGVSRLHLSLRYDADQNAILAADLGSANGSFINGQSLLPKEVRVLRHSDELRLGKLVLMVSFRHPKA
jgi:hypothetical protein